MVLRVIEVGACVRILLVDHYDSFTANLVNWIRLPTDTVAFDRLSSIDAESYDAIVLSPGPKSPDQAQSTCALVDRWLGKVPIFGVCLGHQILGSKAGGQIRRSLRPTHGERRMVYWDAADPIMAAMGPRSEVACYHSLIVEDDELANGWRVIGRSAEGEAMALAYVDGPRLAMGWQFHPESFLTPDADRLRQCFLGFLAEERRPVAYHTQSSTIAPLLTPS